MIMTSLAKLMLSSILITVIVLGLGSPVKAQVSAPTIYVDAPSTVGVSTEFDIIISIHDIQSGWGIVGFGIQVQWDPNDLEYIECEFLGSGRLGTWGGGCGSSGPDDTGGGGGGPPWAADAEWLRFRFHCLREGPAPITVSSPGNSIELEPFPAGGGQVATFPEPVTVIVNQVGPVGGISTPVNKLEILAPYLALAGLMIVVSTVYVIKKRKD
jgi:hypothetical protein